MIAACHGGASDVVGGGGPSDANTSITLVAYSVPEPGWSKVIPAFNASQEGKGVQVIASYGASGDQSRGVVDGKPLSMKDLSALADLPSRDVLLAQIAGLLASPLRTMAGLLKAVPQNFAYGLSALIESKGGVVAPAEDKVEEVAETPAGVEEAAPAASDDDATPVADVTVEDEAPAAEPEAEAPVEEEAPAAEPEAEATVEEEASAAEPEADATEVSQDAEAEPAE